MDNEPRMVPGSLVNAWREALYEIADQNRNDKEVLLFLDVLGEVTQDANNDPDFDWQSGEINFASDRVLRVAR